MAARDVAALVANLLELKLLVQLLLVVANLLSTYAAARRDKAA